MDRHHVFERLTSTRFDLLVIGGGITGAGVAREAALRGLRVALVEKLDFASGTSSRSSRLIHGGVRYLEYGQFAMVRESSRERHLLLQLAPHLVRPLAFTWPIYRGGRLPRWKIGAGLWLYDILARFGNVGRHSRLGAQGILEAEPALAKEGLLGGARYWDATTDDARLTVSNVLGAIDADATVLNHCDVRELTHGGGRVTGAIVVDRLTGAERQVRADVVVNATGPWSDSIRTLDDGLPHTAVRGTKGVHLLLPRDRVGNKEAVTMLSPVDGRVMFVLPAGAFTLVGTTDTRTSMVPERVRATTDDVEYLLRSVNARFPASALTMDDVVSAWAGLRPLVSAGQGSGAGAEGRASREHAITWSDSHLLSVTGGKLTTYRAMAEEVVDVAVGRLHRRAAPSVSHRRPLPGGELRDLTKEIAQATAATGSAAVGEHLVHSHGERWRRVWGLTEMDRSLAERLDPELPYLAAEVVHAATRELACTPADVLIRRFPLAYETRDHGRAVAPLVAELMSAHVGQTAEALLAGYDDEIDRIFLIEPVELLGGQLVNGHELGQS